MNKLPKDLINKLLDEFSPQDFINFCASETSDNIVRICNMNDVWIKRMKKDFPFVLLKFPKVIESSKIVYLELFSKISKQAEEFTETVLNAYGKARKFLMSEFKSFLYGIFYDLIIYTLSEVLKVDYEKEGEISESVSDSYFSDKGTEILYEYLPGLRQRELRTYAYQEEWEEEIEYPLCQFIDKILNFLLPYK